MLCPKCGTPAAPDEKICAKCGSPIVHTPDHADENTSSLTLTYQEYI